MSNRKPNRITLNQQVIRVRERAEAYDRIVEFEAFKRIADTFLSDPTRHDRRGISAGAIGEAHRGYVRFGEVLLVAEEHVDHAVRHQAEKALRAIGRGHVDFQKAAERLKEVRGLNSKAGKRTAERRRADREAKTERPLGDGRHSVRRVFSVTSLQDVGRKLQNCVKRAKEAKEYLQGGSEVWVVLDRGDPLWLLTVDTDGRRRIIDECQGHGNTSAKPAKLGRQAVRLLLDILNASADEEPAFVKAGFHTALPHADIEDDAPVLIDGREYIVHSSDDGVLIGRRRPGKRWKWSPFHWTARGCLEEGCPFEQPISEGMLLGLIAKRPELGAKLRG